MDIHTHHKLTHALTEYDRKQSTRKYYNRYALPQYFGALQSVTEAVDGGQSLRKALTDNFCGRLLDVLLKSVGEPKSTDSEQRF